LKGFHSNNSFWLLVSSDGIRFISVRGNPRLILPLSSQTRWHTGHPAASCSCSWLLRDLFLSFQICPPVTQLAQCVMDKFKTNWAPDRLPQRSPRNTFCAGAAPPSIPANVPTKWCARTGDRVVSCPSRARCTVVHTHTWVLTIPYLDRSYCHHQCEQVLGYVPCCMLTQLSLIHWSQGGNTWAGHKSPGSGFWGPMHAYTHPPRSHQGRRGVMIEKQVQRGTGFAG
jgi:hypothetical protein